MRRSRGLLGGRAHYEVAAVISVLGLAVMGRPILARGQAIDDGSLTMPATHVLDGAQSHADEPSPDDVAAYSIDPSKPLAWFIPGGENSGTQDLAETLARIALNGNEPLYISSEWGRKWGSERSDHYAGNTNAWAVDLAVAGIQRPTPQTEEAAARVAAALGRPGWTGGNLVVTVQGYRFQVLWRVAGHFNHVHVGVRKV